MKKSHLAFCAIVCAGGLLADSSADALPRIAVFGGSFSRIEASRAAKDVWAKELGCSVDTYGVNSCGFEAGREKGNDIAGQVARALKAGVDYRAYVLWGSGNDIGFPASATSNGVERAVKLIRDGAPQAKIVLINSIDEPFQQDDVRAKIRRCAESQKGICARLGVPCLDLFNHSGITRENGRALVSGDDCHMTAAGYAHIAPLTAGFLRKNTGCAHSKMSGK